MYYISFSCDHHPQVFKCGGSLMLSDNKLMLLNSQVITFCIKKKKTDWLLAVKQMRYKTKHGFKVCRIRMITRCRLGFRASWSIFCHQFGMWTPLLLAFFRRRVGTMSNGQSDWWWRRPQSSPPLQPPPNQYLSASLSKRFGGAKWIHRCQLRPAEIQSAANTWPKFRRRWLFRHHCMDAYLLSRSTVKKYLVSSFHRIVNVI